MVDYFTLEELPDVRMFRCERRHATLRVEACGQMWLAANDRGAPERLDQCRNCTIGAKHAGVGEISLSPLRGMSICARCDQGATRLVRKHICVSCYNREREYLIGKNAKGSIPKMHPPLHDLSIRFRAGDVVQVLRIDKAVSTKELIIAALRDTSKQVTFSFRNQPVLIPQREMNL